MKRVIPLLILFSLHAAPIHVDVGAGPIYWKPFQAGFDYALKEADVLTLRPDYSWGWTVFGQVKNDFGDYVRGSYTHLAISANVRRTVTQSLRYRTADLHVGHLFCHSKNAEIYGFAGGRYLYVKEKRRVDDDRHLLSFNGVGPEIGLGAHSAEWCGFSAFGELRVLAAIGNRRATQTALHFKQHTVCLPVLFFKMGGAYRFCLFALRFDVEAGYALDYFFQINKEDELIGTDPRTVQTKHSDLGFGGPYLTLQVGY